MAPTTGLLWMALRRVALGFCIAIGAISTCDSGYIVKGRIEGSICSNWVVFSTCHLVDVDAIEGDGGKLFTVTDRFETVNEYTGERCFIRLQHDGWIEWLVRNATGPVFFTKLPDGKFKKVAVEYLTFACEEENKATAR